MNLSLKCQAERARAAKFFYTCLPGLTPELRTVSPFGLDCVRNEETQPVSVQFPLKQERLEWGTGPSKCIGSSVALASQARFALSQNDSVRGVGEKCGQMTLGDEGSRSKP